MIALIFLIFNLAAALFKSKSRLEAENAALRHQLIVLQRKVRALVPFTNSDRLFFVQLYRWFSSVLKGVTIIRPETIVRWHRAGWRCSPILREPGASGSERIRCAARKPRITAPGREKLQQGAEQQG
jgi:hypothetical protein